MSQLSLVLRHLTCENDEADNYVDPCEDEESAIFQFPHLLVILAEAGE